MFPVLQPQNRCRTHTRKKNASKKISFLGIPMATLQEVPKRNSFNIFNSDWASKIISHLERSHLSPQMYYL